MPPARPFRVAITLGPPGPGGISTYVRELINALACRTDLELVVVGSDAARAELRHPITDHVRLRGGRLAEHIGVAALGPLLARRRVDIVHGTRQVIPLVAAPPSVLSFYDDFAFTRRDDYDRVKRWLLPPVYRRALATADGIVTLSSGELPVARRYVGPDTPVVDAGAAVGGALAGASVGPRPPDLSGPYALVVGDAGPRKRIDWLLDRWTAITDATDLQLVIAGGRAADATLVERLERSPAAFRRLPGDDELATLYAHATVVVDASAAEGFGFPRVEAAHFGVPYVELRTDADPLPAIAAALDPATTSGAPALPTTWDDVADRTVALYRRVLDAS